MLYRLTVVGEIAGVVSPELRSRHPEVPWPRIRAFRNTAIHEYLAIEWALVQPIAEVEAPRLHAQVLAIARAEFPEIAQRHEEET